MRGVAPVLLCGCNAVFGIEGTQPYDAPPAVDARPPPVCSPLGGDAPVFTDDLRQLTLARGCNAYALIGETRAGVSCRGNVSLGPIDGPFDAMPVVPDPGGVGLSGVRFGPEGDVFFTTFLETTDPITTSIYEYRVDPSGTWTKTPQAIYTDLIWIGSISTPSRGPDRRLLYPYSDPNTGENAFRELQDTGAGWSKFGDQRALDLGVSSFETPNLSPDGLRLVFVSYSQVMKFDQPELWYTDRQSRSDPFGQARKIASVPPSTFWPYLTEDCGRMYYSALDTVFYQSQ